MVKKNQEKKLDSLEKKCTLLIILDFRVLRGSNLKIPIFSRQAHSHSSPVSYHLFFTLTVSDPVQDGLACITPLINPFLEVILMGTSTH